MRSVFSWVLLLGLAAPCISGCGGDASTEQSPVTFSNHFLWQVGNCEVGTLTPVDPVTGDAELCGNQAKEVSECVGTNLFTITIRGMDVTMSQTVNGATTSESFRFERSLDCTHEPALDRETCDKLASALATYEKLFVIRAVERVPEEQLYSDGLWAIMDKPWPGASACAAELPL